MHAIRWMVLSLCLWMGMGLASPQAHAQTSPGAAPTALMAAPAPLTRPGRVGTGTLNGADTAWMMTSTALVLLMTLPGIAIFYGGMVRRKSVLNVMACVVAICAIVSLLWFALGYSIAFTPGSGLLGHFIGWPGTALVCRA